MFIITQISCITQRFPSQPVMVHTVLGHLFWVMPATAGLHPADTEIYALNKIPKGQHWMFEVRNGATEAT